MTGEVRLRGGMVSDQMDYLRMNLGEWHGSFSQLSVTGEVEKDSPSFLTLKEQPESGQVDLELQVFDPVTGDRTRHINLSFTSIGGNIAFFETGAFTQGSLQHSPVGEFGAELGFIAGDRRHRQVQLYKPGSQVPRITTIREYREGSDAVEQPPLTVESLLGRWQGEAIIYYADWRPSDRFATELMLTREGDRLIQSSKFADVELTSSAKIGDRELLFDEGKHPVKVMLLADGSSATIPVGISNNAPFFLEAGWLYADNKRQRLVRRYSEKGSLESIVAIVEARR